jgi:hypothetical protein
MRDAERSSRIIALLTLLLVAGMVGIVAFAAHDIPHLSNAVAVTAHGDRFGVTPPFVDESRAGAADYRIEAILNEKSPVQGVVHITPDDCLTRLEVNGRVYPLRQLSATALCDWRGGFDVDLGAYVHPGPNAISLSIHNNGGPWGLKFRPSPFDRTMGFLDVAVVILFVPYLVAVLWLAGVLRSRRRLFWVAAGLIAAAAAIRFAFMFALHPPDDYVYSDMAAYVDEASRILSGHRGRDLLFHPIGYPLLLALSLHVTQSLALVVLLQFLMSVATVVLMWRGSARFLREGPALVVLALAAVHVPFVSLGGFFMAETAFAFFLALLFYLVAARPFPWSPAYALVAGFVYMAAAWMKGNDSLFGPILMAWIAVRVWRSRAYAVPARWKAAAKAAAGFVAGACLVASITAFATYSVAGHPRIAAATGALNFVEGKCPDKINHDMGGTYWYSPLFVQLGEAGEKYWPAYFWDDAYFWKAGWQCVRDNPRVLVTSARYVYYLFFGNQLWPSGPVESEWNRWYGMFVSFVIFPGMLVGLVLVARRPLAARTPAFLLVVSLFVTSWLLKSELRYRVPFDVAILPLSVLGWTYATTALRRRLRPRLAARSSA